MRILNIEARSDINVLPAVKKALPQLDKKIGLVTTVQHIGELAKVKKLLESKGKQVFMGKGTTYEGQVLGCNVKAATKIESKVDCFLYIGTGEFHPLGVALETDKKVIVANPSCNYVKVISEAEKRKYLAKKAARMAKAKDCSVFGLFVSTKPGQNRIKEAEKVKTKLEKQGKEAYIFLGDLISPLELLNFPQIDCWVNTACPRIVDDQESYDKLIVNYDEI